MMNLQVCLKMVNITNCSLYNNRMSGDRTKQEEREKGSHSKLAVNEIR